MYAHRGKARDYHRSAGSRGRAVFPSHLFAAVVVRDLQRHTWESGSLDYLQLCAGKSYSRQKQSGFFLGVQISPVSNIWEDNKFSTAILSGPRIPN